MRSFTTAVFKSKCAHEIVKTLNIKATAVRYCGENYSVKICKIRGKTSIVEFNFSKIVGHKSEAVIYMELFLNVSLGILQSVFQNCSKNKTYKELILELVSFF